MARTLSMILLVALSAALLSGCPVFTRRSGEGAAAAAPAAPAQPEPAPAEH